MTSKRVLVGMSGGVDSSLAAALVKDAGFETSGVTMELTRKLPTDKPGFANHGSIEDSADAKKVADKIGIPFEVWDMSELYRDKVVKAFIEGYKRGDTPNPCVSCNQNVKFAALVAKARELGFDMVATGHYARIGRKGDEFYQNSGKNELHRGVNYFKDQSYFVASMPPEVTEFCYFPLGSYFDKSETRKQAKELGFETHDKKDSADICFLEKGAKSKFLGAHFGDSFAGNIIDENGDIIGKHNGYWNYTIGQRKGVIVKNKDANEQPRYVIEIRPETKEVVVGPKELLLKSEVSCREARIFADDRVTLNAKTSGFAQIRGHGKVIPCMFTVDSNANVNVKVDMSRVKQNMSSTSVKTTDFAKTSVQTFANGGDVKNNDFLDPAKQTNCFDSVARGQSLVIYDPEYNSRVLLKATIMR